MANYKVAKWTELNAEQKQGFMQTMVDADVVTEEYYKREIEPEFVMESDILKFEGLCMLRDGKPIASLLFMKGRRYVNMCYAASPYTGVVKEFYRVSGSLANARTPMEELFVQVINQNPSLEVVRSMVPLESAKTFLERVTSKGWLTTAGEPGGEFWYVDRSKVPKPLNLEETQLRATEVGVLEQKVAVKPGDRRRNTN